MKIKRNQLIILLIIGLIFPLLINNNIISGDEQKSTVTSPKSSAGYNLSFIHIDGSITDNWTDTVYDYNWCYVDSMGRYVIENVTIDADDSPTGSGILINNSRNIDFIIRNCTISNADNVAGDSGIRLENTNNGTILNNNCSDNKYGIYLLNCDVNNITDNIANNNKVNGIYLDTNCEYNNITGNTANNNLFGIQLVKNCNYNNITLNTANNNGDYGIYINSAFGLSCNNNTILNNTANENNDYGIFITVLNYENSVINNTANNNIRIGIYMQSSYEFNITGNTINNNRRGIELQSCDNSNIMNNTINSNLEIGINLENSDSNEIKNNTLNGNDLGIRLDDSNNNNITGNTLKDNNWCILETDCVGNIIEYNDCSSPTVEFPIYIDDYATGVDAHNWTWAEQQSWFGGGLGTKEEPYIIDNLKISGFGIIDYGIDIRNSNVSFIIRECLIYNSDQAGIYLDNVNNSRLINNNCSNNRNGIYAEFSNNITIFENTLNSNNNDGIRVEESNYVNITGNTVNNNGGDGIDIDTYNFSYIIENIVNGNSEKGIYLLECVNNSISGNDANNNEYGIYLGTYCYNNTISGNTANGNIYDGIYLEESDYNSIIENMANNNDNAGIILSGSDHNYISENFANDNIYNGIYLDGECSYNIISGNYFNENEVGIYLYYYCDFNDVIGNTANNNDFLGISLGDSNNNTISGNTVNNNQNTGIYIEDDSDENDILGNIIYNNTQGIYFEPDCGNNSVYKNFFLKNGKHAVDDSSNNDWNSTSIGNYWDNHTGPDANNDGIVDDPYTFIGGSTGSTDYLPIAEDGAPRITINSPNSGDGFGIIAPSFDVEITDIYVISRWYTIDGGLNNITFTENGMINQSAWDALVDGPAILKFYASDIVENIGSAEVSIIKDTVDPIIIINSPVEGDRFGKNAPLFNITVTELNLDVIWYSFDGGVTTYAITNNTIFNQTTWTALAQGNITITFYVRDIAGNEATEEVTVIKSVPSGLDPGVIVIIVVSIVGGVAVISVVYFFMKKRTTP